VDKDLKVSSNQLDKLNEHELVVKVSEAITSMGGQTGQGPEEAKVVRARRLHNSGVIYKLNMPEAAGWLWKEKVTFIQCFCGTSVLHNKSVAVMVEYVPISHSPNTLEENSKIKHDSRLAAGELVLTRWIKAVQR